MGLDGEKESRKKIPKGSPSVIDSPVGSSVYSKRIERFYCAHAADGNFGTIWMLRISQFHATRYDDRNRRRKYRIECQTFNSVYSCLCLRRVSALSSSVIDRFWFTADAPLRFYPEETLPTVFLLKSL